MFLGTRHHSEFNRNLIAISKNAIHFGYWAASKAIGQTASNTLAFFDQYHRINVDFESEGGNNLPMACFYETVKTPIPV